MNTLPPDAVYDLTRPLEVAVSPDGTRVAVQVLNYDRKAGRRRAILVVPADGSREPTRLVPVGAAAMAWHPDGTRLGVVLTRTPEDARTGGDGVDSASATDGGADPQLWVYDLERDGAPRQVTSHDGGVHDFDWGPDGERVVIAAPDATETVEQRHGDEPFETERLQHKLDGVGWLDGPRTCLHVVDVDSSASRRLPAAHGDGITGAADGLQPAWHPTADRVAFVANHGDHPDDTYVQDIHVVDVTTGETTRLTGYERMVGSPTWSPDGSRLAYAAGDPDNWYVPTGVRVVDIDSGVEHALTDGLDRGLAWFEQLAWLDDEQVLTAIGDRGWSRFVRLAVDGGHERVYDQQTRTASLTGFDVGGNTVAFGRQGPRTGIDVFALDVAGLDAAPTDADPRRLTDLNPSLVADYAHPEVERLTVAGADGDPVECLVFAPPAFDPADPAGDRPLLCSIHGGPRRYDEPQFDFDTAFWTTRGYVVCKVNYHGSTSYGRAFCERLRGAWNDVEVTDIRAATDALVERGWVDSDRLFVTGFSFGGRTTAATLAATDCFAAGVAEHGNYDARAAFGADDRQRWWTNELGLPWERPEAYDEASVITDVDAIETPLLLTAGEDDLRDPPAQAEQLYVSLKKRGRDAKLVVYPDTSHVHYFVADPGRAVHRLETMAAWFRRFDPTVDHTGGERG